MRAPVLDSAVLTGFFTHVDRKYFNETEGMWDEGHAYGICTVLNSSIAPLLIEQGHRAEIRGLDDDAAVKTGLHSKFDLLGGHDWLVVDDRYIVDIWAVGYLQLPKPLFDLEDPADRQFVAETYGSEQNWARVPFSPTAVAAGAADWQDYLPTVLPTLPGDTSLTESLPRPPATRELR